MADQKFFSNDTHDLDLNLDALTGNQSLSVPDTSGTIAVQSFVTDLFNTGSRKQGVKAATTANITLSGTQTIDGIALIAGDEVLVKNQSTGSENGVYTVAAGAWTRRADFDADVDVAAGASIFVLSGTTNGDTGWLLVTASPVVGTTALVFSQFGVTSAPVDSVYGRTGAVTATAGDYTATQVTNVPAGDIAAVTVQAAITELDTEKTSIASLAATTASNGASLVGVEDAGANFTATTVEGVLTEIAGTLVTSTATVEGLIELATAAEVLADDATRAVTGATLAANYTKTTALAAVTASNGASLIGVQDAAGDFTGATVEAVLAEIGVKLITSTATAEGLIELATAAEVLADDATRAVTGATLAANYTKTTSLAATTASNGASLIGIQDAAGLYTGTTVETAMAEVGADAADLRTLSGTADGAVNYGTFTGSTIGDNVTNKVALQTLETALEAGVLSGTAPTYTSSNVTTLRTIDADAITLQGLADVLASTIEDLKTRGVFQ